MSEPETLLDKAKFYLQQHEISFSDAVIISNLGMHSKKNHVLVLSGFNIIILTQKKVSKNIAKKYDKSIFDISSISLSTLYNIEINFRKTKSSNEFKLIFQIEDCKKIIYMIVNYIHRLLAPFEFNRISIDESATPSTLAPRTSHSILSRLNFQLEANEIEVPENLLKKVSHHLYSHLNSFIFSKFRKMKKFFPIFFPCMSMARWVNQIDIYSPKHVFRLMFKQMECFDNIVHVKIRGTESKELQDFVEQSQNVSSLSFHDRPVNTFDFVSVLIQNHKVDSIGFDSALDDVSYRLFMNSPSFDQLSYFRVSNLSQLDFISYFHKFRQLKVLSLTSCNLKIGTILEELITNQVTTLKKLDLSGNLGDGFQRFYTRIRKGVSNQQQQFKRPKTLGPSNRLNLNHPGFQETDKTDVKISLPCRLDALFVNEVEWDVDQLIFFMRLCSNSVITNLSMNSILFLNPNNRNNQSGTNNNNNNENRSQKRKKNRRRNNNNNDDDQNIVEEEEELNDNDDDDDYYDDDEDDSEFAMSSSNEITNYNKKSNSANNIDVANWSALFDNFPKQMNSVRSLNWNSNKITNEFVDFLLASTRLNEISFCGCNCSDISFIETLLKKHRIQKVNLKQIQFNTNLLYFHTFKNFLSNISQMKSVKQIDLSHNKIDDECFDTLSISLMKSNLEFIALDNSNASSSDFLYQFYHKLEKSREQPITISYPFIDFQRLEVDNFKEYDFIQCFSNLKKPLSKRTTEIPKYLPEVSFLRLDNNFPQFLSKDRNGPDLNRNQTPPIINEQIPSTNNENDNNNDETNNKNKQNTNNHRRTQSVNNARINMNFDDDDDDFPKPKNINSRNLSPKINSRRAPNTYYFNNDSTSEETPRSTFKKTQHTNTTNNRKFVSPNRIVTNLNFDDDDDDNNNNNYISTKSNTRKRSNSTTNQRGNIYGNSDLNSTNKSTSNNKRNKNLSPTSLNRQTFDDPNYNNNFIKHSRKNSDFMNFSPSSDRRKWKRQEPENWKPRVLPIPPKIDNTEIFINYKREFSIQRLTNKMVKK